jgi:hypothetical protein
LLGRLVGPRLDPHALVLRTYSLDFWCEAAAEELALTLCCLVQDCCQDAEGAVRLVVSSVVLRSCLWLMLLTKSAKKAHTSSSQPLGARAEAVVVLAMGPQNVGRRAIQ